MIPCCKYCSYDKVAFWMRCLWCFHVSLVVVVVVVVVVVGWGVGGGVGGWGEVGGWGMFARPYIPQSLCSPSNDIRRYVSHVPQSLCSREMFPSHVAPKTYISQSLFSPPMFPLIPNPYVQSLCSPVCMLPRPNAPQALCSPVTKPPPPAPMYPISPTPAVLFSLVPMLTSPFAP